MSRPFLFFVSLDEDGRHVLQIQGDGIPLTQRRLSIDDCLRHSRAFAQAAIEILEVEKQEKEDARRGGTS